MTKYAELTPEAKQRRNRQNAASRARYERTAYTKMTFRIRTDGSDGLAPEQIKHAADQAGLSVNAWILEALRDKL